MKYSFDGIGSVTATFGTADGADIAPGTPVKISAAAEVTACAASEDFIGIVLSCRAGCACVQLAGCVTVACSGSLTPGYTKLAADGSAGITTGSGRDRLVLDVQTGSATIML
jgi:hypothetical protein